MTALINPASASPRGVGTPGAAPPPQPKKFGSNIKKPAQKVEISLNPKLRQKDLVLGHKKGKRLGKGGPPLSTLHMLVWNVNGLLGEKRVSLILRHIQQTWPQVDVILLTETHLLESHCNPDLQFNPLWDISRLDHVIDQTGHIKTGGLILLTRKNKFHVERTHSFLKQHVTAGTWKIMHNTWRQPFEITGIYRPWPHGSTAEIADIQESQLEVLNEATAHLASSPLHGILAGDLNLHLGKLQEDLTHPFAKNLPPRLSEHDPSIAPSSLSAKFMQSVRQHETLILNGRYGIDSARHTYIKGAKNKTSHTIIDYALAHQSLIKNIKNMRIETDTAGLSDHRPIRLAIACAQRGANDKQDPTISQWLPPIDRQLLDITPISLPAWEEEGVQSKYQSLLHSKLSPSIAMLRTMTDKAMKCNHRKAQKSTCPPSCICTNLHQQIDDVYSQVTTSILEAAEACLPRKPVLKPEGGQEIKRIPTWRPDKHWHELKSQERTAWAATNNTSLTAQQQIELTNKHKKTCFALQAYTEEARNKWLNKRLSTISLFASPYTVKSSWQKLKARLGGERQTGLPATVATAEGQILHGKAADQHWHRARSQISTFDPLAPFSEQAHARRTLKLDHIKQQERQKAYTDPLKSPVQDPMNGAISRDEVQSRIANTSSGTAPGVDTIYNEFLTHGGEPVLTALHLLFNLVWLDEQGPKEWDLALIRPIYKTATKDPLKTENYRAVTLINTICKVFEDILCVRVVSHLEQQKMLSPSQGGSRAFLGCSEMVYALISAVRERHRSTGQGTYACFIDFRLAYPSTDHSVIFSKLYDTGVKGRLWRMILSLYSNMQSRVLHPNISQDDYFDIEIGVREGSVLSPILFLAAIDDMRDYLAKNPFHEPRGTLGSKGAPRLKRNRPPGLWIGENYLGLLQYVDDAVLLARSPAELQHMIKIIAQYCHENRLKLNPKRGKTEVVEFMCPPSGVDYKVSAPTFNAPNAVAPIGVVEGYPYLGWHLDKWLTLDQHTKHIAHSVTAATARVVQMGGRPAGLPIRTTFQLWSSLALPYVYGAAALLTDKQVQYLQSKIHTGVQQMVGSRVEPAAVLADLGLPDAYVIRDIQLGNLFARLQTLPIHLLLAALHRYLHTKSQSDSTGLEGDMYQLLDKLHSLHLWHGITIPASDLCRITGRQPQHKTPLIRAKRTELDNHFKRCAWRRQQSLISTNTAPHDSDKMQTYAQTISLQVSGALKLNKCAAYLQMDLSPQQETCLLLFRAQGTILASHDRGSQHDDRCDGCRTQNPGTQDQIEDIAHALFHCCKEPHQSEREQFMQSMREVISRFHPYDALYHPISWDTLDQEIQTRLALSGPIPHTWKFKGIPTGYQTKRAQEEMQAALTVTAVPYLQTVARGLRAYRQAVLQSLEDGDTTDWTAIHNLWDMGPMLDDISSEEDDSE